MCESEMDQLSGFSDHEVANAFIEQYYTFMDKFPENVHKFYKDSSQLGWQGTDGVVMRVTTLSGINDKIMSSDYKNWSIDIKNVDAQDSQDGGIIVVVTGSLTGNDITEKTFSQTFFLARQETGFFILNDILRFVDECDLTTNVATCNLGPKDEETQNSGVEDENIMEVSDHLPPKENSVTNDASGSSTASHQDMHLLVTPQPNVKDDAPKLTYASILRKESHATSPKAVNVPSKDDLKSVLTTLGSALLPADAASKMSASSRIKSQPSAQPRNILSKPNNGGSNTNAYAEGCGIYVGNLPSAITKNGIIEVIEKFGSIRRGLDGIRIRRHEDGFCCCFVEFESANSARRAVEAHHIHFGEKKSYIMYKRPLSKGNNHSEQSLQRARYSQNRLGGKDVPNSRFESNDRRGFNKVQASPTAQPSRSAAQH